MMDDDKDVNPLIKDTLKSLVGLFECTICCNLLTQPSQTQCGHIFCSDCIKNITKTEKADAKCPNCRRKLNRRAVRVRDDIAELNLAVRYLEGTLMGELTKKDDHPSSGDNCADFEFEDDDNNVSQVTSQLSQLPAFTQSQPLDLSMLKTNSNISNTNMMDQSGGKRQLESLGSTIKFVEPLDLSNKKRPREIISEIYHQPENCSRRHPRFLQGERESLKRQKLHDDFVDHRTENNYQPISGLPTFPYFACASSNMNVENGDVEKESNNDFNKVLDKDRKIESKRQKETSNNDGEIVQLLDCDKEPILVNQNQRLPDDFGSHNSEHNIQPITPVAVASSTHAAPSVVEIEIEKQSNNNNNAEEMEIEHILGNDKECITEQPEQQKFEDIIGSSNLKPSEEKDTCQPMIIASTPTPPEPELNAPASSFVEAEVEKESSDTESDEDQVIPCTPVKKDRPVSPDSSCAVNNPNNENNDPEQFNSRSTFASPLPSQWNVNSSTPLPLASQKSQPRRKFIMCPSRLNRVELAKLSDLCSVCDGTISKDYTDEVTHLIIKLEKGRVPQTMKYLFAIADKKWIIVYDWVLECLMQGEMVPEEPYETSSFPESDCGVRKSRLSPSQLLFNVPFYFPTALKGSGASTEDCKKLVEKMGGTILDSAFEVSVDTGVIIIGESGIQSKHLYQELYKSRGCLSVGWTWVLDCVLTYSIAPFTKTHLLTKLDGSATVHLPSRLIDVNSCTPLSSQFNSHPSKTR